MLTMVGPIDLDPNSGFRVLKPRALPLSNRAIPQLQSVRALMAPNTHNLNINLQWNSVNSTSDNPKTCLTQTKLHGPCLGNDFLLGISRTCSHNSN